MDASHLKSADLSTPSFFHSRKLSVWIPLFLIFYNVTANLSNDIYLPSLPNIGFLFATTSSLMQLTLTAWFMGNAAPQLFFGPLSDRVGRCPVLFGGGICFVIASMACSLAPNVWVLIVARFFQGVGVCSLNVASFSILNDLYHYNKRVRIMSYINMCGSLAPLLGPIIGGYISLWFGWRANFILIFSLGIISLLGLKINLQESNLSLNPYAIHLSWLSKNYIVLLKNKIFLLHLIPYCLILGGLIAYLTASSFLIIDKMGVAPENFGYLQIPIFGAYIVGAFLLNYATAFFKAKTLLSIGLIIVLIASINLALGSYFIGNNLWILIICMSFYALGFSLCSSLLVAETMGAANAQLTGSSAALLGFGMALACALSSSLTGLFYNGAMLSLAVIIFMMVLMATICYSRIKTSPFSIR